MGGTHHSFKKRFSRSSGGIFNDTLPWRFICSRFINTAKKLPIMKSTVPLKSRPIFYKNFCCKKWTNESCYIISLGDPTFSMISAVKMNKEKWKCHWLCLGTDLIVCRQLFRIKIMESDCKNTISGSDNKCTVCTWIELTFYFQTGDIFYTKPMIVILFSIHLCNSKM